jgi:hypothetical protein
VHTSHRKTCKHPFQIRVDIHAPVSWLRGQGKGAADVQGQTGAWRVDIGDPFVAAFFSPTATAPGALSSAPYMFTPTPAGVSGTPTPAGSPGATHDAAAAAAAAACPSPMATLTRALAALEAVGRAAAVLVAGDACLVVDHTAGLPLLQTRYMHHAGSSDGTTTAVGEAAATSTVHAAAAGGTPGPAAPQTPASHGSHFSLASAASAASAATSVSRLSAASPAARAPLPASLHAHLLATAAGTPARRAAAIFQSYHAFLGCAPHCVARTLCYMLHAMPPVPHSTSCTACCGC